MEQEFYLELIRKYIEGTLSEPEQTKLQTWLDTSDENRQLLQDVEAAWEESARLSAKAEVDLDAEFAILEEHMDDSAPHEGKVKSLRGRSETPRIYLRLAAGIVLLAVIGLVVWRFLPGSEPEWLSAEAGDVSQNINLSDGSVVTLGPGSRLEYPETFAGAKREVRLRGRAYFEVAADAAHPFEIGLEKAEIRVLGTAFNVMEATAPRYSVRVEVDEGRVALSDPGSGQQIEVTAGEAAVFGSQGGAFALSPTSYDANALAWKTRKLSFQNAGLEVVFKSLRDYYGIPLEWDKADLPDCPLTADFEDMTAEELLEAMRVVIGLETEKQGDTYIVRSVRC